MIDSRLLNEYRRARQRHRHLPSLPASHSLATARLAIENRDISCAGYMSCDPAPDIGTAFKIGPDSCRWIENYHRNGLRFVGYADKLANIRHTGWHLDPDCVGETARGMVLQWPARGGEPMFAPAVQDPYNDEAAIVCTSAAFADAREAAFDADGLACLYAENERAYQEASAARLHYDELADHIATTRDSVRKLIAEIREHAQHLAKGAPAVCAALRSTIKSRLCSIREARRTRADLLNNFGRTEGWQQ